MTAPAETVEATVTQQDIDNILILAQNAPLRNLREAQEVSALLTRFQQWTQKQLAPKPGLPATRRARANGATPPESPKDDSKAEDVLK